MTFDEPQGPHRLIGIAGAGEDGTFLGLSVGTESLPPGWYQFHRTAASETVESRWYLAGVVLSVSDVEADLCIDTHLQALGSICAQVSGELEDLVASLVTGNDDTAAAVLRAMSYVDVISDLAQQAATVVHRLELPDERRAIRPELVERTDHLVVQAIALAGVLSETADLGETKMRRPQRRIRMVGRNDLCPCGSGKKYKVCCQRRHQAP